MLPCLITCNYLYSETLNLFFFLLFYFDCDCYLCIAQSKNRWINRFTSIKLSFLCMDTLCLLKFAIWAFMLRLLPLVLSLICDLVLRSCINEYPSCSKFFYVLSYWVWFFTYHSMKNFGRDIFVTLGWYYVYLKPMFIRAS